MIWSSVLVAVGVLGLWLAGSGKSAGWFIGLFAQVLWVAYAIVTKQYPFIVSAVVYAFVYARNWNRAAVQQQVQVAGDNSVQIQAGGNVFTPNELRGKSGLDDQA